MLEGKAICQCLRDEFSEEKEEIIWESGTFFFARSRLDHGVYHEVNVFLAQKF